MSTAHVVSDRVELDARIVRHEMTEANRGGVAAHQPDPAQRPREADVDWLVGHADLGPAVSFADRLLLASDIEYGRRAAPTYDMRVPSAEEIQRHTGMTPYDYDLAICEQAADYADMVREALAIAGGV